MTYVGDLATQKYLALVDSSYSANDPCVFGSVAAATADVTHSAAQQAPSGEKEVTFPQSTLLSVAPVYALCYAETDGATSDSTWRDSYIRFRMTQVETLSLTSGALASSYAFKTSGQMACIADLRITYSGSLYKGKYLSLVDSTLNSNDPCSDGTVAAAAQDTQHSGSLTAIGVIPSGKTLSLSTSTLDTTKTFAVCYSDEDGLSTSDWQDAGMRFIISKISSLLYGSPVVRTLTSTVKATHVVPESGVAVYTYVGDLDNAKWLSMVDSTLNTNNPCGQGSIAGAAPDATHSGPVQAGSSDKAVNILAHHRLGTFDLSSIGQAMDTTKTYAVCYAETDGTMEDLWVDTYVRLKVSKLQTVVTNVKTLMTSGQLPNSASVALTYTGTLANNKWVSLVDQALNANYPCSSGTIAAHASDGYHSGSHQAGATNKLITLDVTGLSTTTTFAVCYSDSGGATTDTWHESGLRLTVSQIKELTFGVPSRAMSSTNSATNRLPQVANMVITYHGDLVNHKWVSLVDSTLNTNDPCRIATCGVTTAGVNACVVGQTSAASEDPTHSGAQRAASGTKAVTIPQSTLLDETKTYAVCYSSTNGGTTDDSWADAAIRIKISKIRSVSSHSVTHETSGQVATVSTLQLSYTGTLADNQWLSMVDSSLNAAFPCASGSVAAANADTQHSGISQAGSSDKTVTLDTSSLSSAAVFSVCYSEGSGSSTDSWFDSGIRLTVSKMTGLQYGSPIRLMTSANIAEATNRLPQISNMVLTYVGDLPASKWMSLVDSTLNSNNPCDLNSVAAAAADTLHSGAMKGSNTKQVIVPQLSSSTLLDISKTFAVCYAEVDGSNEDQWADSYVRIQMSKIESITTSAMIYETSGGVANTASLSVTYSGVIGNNKYLSMVDQTLNSVCWYNQCNPQPCASGAIAAATADSLHTGSDQAGANDKIVQFDSSGLSVSTTFAVCYTEDSPGDNTASWSDSGIRLTVSKVSSIHYGAPTREMTSVILATNRLPQVASVVVTYIGALDNGKWLSLIDSTLNDNEPCISATVAGAVEDSTHSSPSGGNTGSKVVTFPQSTLLSETKTFAVCYAENDDFDLDSTWRDSYIRVQMSKIETLVASTVSHRTAGTVASIASLALTYQGSLTDYMWVSLVDSSLNSAFPCDDGNVAAAQGSSQHTGPTRAASSSSIITIDSSTLSTDKVFAACYAETLGNNLAAWIDAGIRLRVSKVSSLYYGAPSRQMTAAFVATNRFPSCLAPR
jgi:hypothetical protein